MSIRVASHLTLWSKKENPRYRKCTKDVELTLSGYTHEEMPNWRSHHKTIHGHGHGQSELTSGFKITGSRYVSQTVISPFIGQLRIVSSDIYANNAIGRPKSHIGQFYM